MSNLYRFPKAVRKMKERQHQVLISNAALYRDNLFRLEEQIASMRESLRNCEDLLAKFEEAHDIKKP